MTPNEHEKLRLQMHVLAQKCLLDWLCDVLRRSCEGAPYPAALALRSQFQERLSRAHLDYQTMTLDWLHPAESDLQAALFQEAFDAVSKDLMRKVFDSRQGGPDP